MRRRLAIVAVLALVGGCDQPGGEPVMRTEIGSGVQEIAVKREQASDCQVESFDDVRFTHCVADPARHGITVALGESGGQPYRSLKVLADGRNASAPDVSFAMNAGMFDEDGQPIGYYVENGARQKELSRASGPGNFHMLPNGVFFGTGSKWQVRTADDFYRNVADRPEFGTQSGPMLVIGGKLHPQISENGPSRTVRNGVGVDRQGRAHFVISEGPVSFGQLARYFRDALETPNALYLDGTVSALWHPASNRLDTGAPLGPLIVVAKGASANP